LDPTPDTVTDVFSTDRPPVLTVDPGDRLVVHTLNCSGHLERQTKPGAQPPKLIENSRGHCLAGPIAVRGAQPGMTLALHLESITPDDWGFTVAGAADNPLNRRLGIAGNEPAWLLWDIETGRATNDRGQTVTTAPFLGVMGLPPAEPGEHSTIPPRPSGGNIDCRELTAGTTLFLPVTVPDALLCLGDGHAAQGDGEVSGTAIECGMTTTLTVELITSPELSTVHATTKDARITFGFSEDLNEATGQALDSMLNWLQVIYDVDKTTALAMASPTVDMRITQIVNQVWGVHALLRNNAIR
jgi:acetamidase/formamidase